MNNKKEYLEQRHPYPPYVPAGATGLILGSAPPARFCLPRLGEMSFRDMDYYYGSYNRGYNLFWEVMFRALDPAGLSGLERIRLLDGRIEGNALVQREFLRHWLCEQGLGIADILTRFNRSGGGAGDGQLQALAFLDLMDILDGSPLLSVIYCTSRHKVYIWLSQYLAGQGIRLDGSGSGGSFILPSKEPVAGSGRLITIHILPSPSPVGRLRFPGHTEFLEYLANSYRAIFITNDAGHCS
jgi:hypothetical protein